MGILEAILIAASLCADCFAVSLCSSVTLKSLEWKKTAFVALCFAIIQSALLLAGWAFGYLFVGMVEKISHIIAFLLLLYVGGSMFLEGLKAIRSGEEGEGRDLNGFRNIVIGGVATSIDALAVGVAQSMAGASFKGFLPLLVSVFAVTALSVIGGICGGKAIGARLGHWAEITGGLVLVCIGVAVLV